MYDTNLRITVPAGNVLSRVQRILKDSVPVPFWVKDEAVEDLESIACDYSAALHSRKDTLALETDLNRASDHVRWVLKIK